MKDKSKLAIDHFKSGFNCAQSVFLTFAKELEIDEKTAVNIAAGFGAGIGREQEICGAVSGAIMTLGLSEITCEQTIKEENEILYNKTSNFIGHFRDKFGTVNCRFLLDQVNLNTEQGLQAYEDQEMFKTRCSEFVKYAVEILEKQLK